MERKAWIMPLALGLIAAALVVGVPRHASSPPLSPEIPARRRAPMTDFTLPTLNGPKWRLSQHRGQVVLLNFWATWCPPCQEETPRLAALSEEFGAQGLDVIGVSMDQGDPFSKSRLLQSFVSAYHIPYPILLPRPLSPLTTLGQAVPTTILIDRQGRIANASVGALDEASFRVELQRLLREPLGKPGAAKP